MALGQRVGLTLEQVTAVAKGSAASFTPLEQAVLDFTHQLADTGTVSDRLGHHLKAMLPVGDRPSTADRQYVELVQTIAMALANTATSNALHVQETAH